MRKNRVVRKKRIKSNASRLRLSVFRSNLNIFAQIINDNNGETLVSASSLKIKGVSKTKAAQMVGEQLATQAKEKNIVDIVFDRGIYLYAGRLKALAEAARQNGLNF